MHPDSRLSERWQYFVRGVERHPIEARSVADLTFLDPACGSGHFLVYAFDLLWDMYQEEGHITELDDICRSILERNLYGIDIDERSVQIAAVALYLKAKERAPQRDHQCLQRTQLGTHRRVVFDPDAEPYGCPGYGREDSRRVSWQLFRY